MDGGLSLVTLFCQPLTPTTADTISHMHPYNTQNICTDAKKVEYLNGYPQCLRITVRQNSYTLRMSKDKRKQALVRL